MRKILLAAALAASLAALAQQPSPPGPGGPGMRGNDNVPGWSMMTAEERKAHQDKMRSFKDRESCAAYMAEHHKQMEARAKERGQTLPAEPAGRGCEMRR